MNAEGIVALLREHRFCYVDESELQDGMAGAFEAAGVKADREVPLNAKDRVDFLIDRTGCEVKFTGPWRAVDRQLRRYLQSDRIDEILLVTVKSNHRRIEQGWVMAGEPPRRKRLLVYQLATSGL